ncbi:MAG: FAD-binding oxidoreductase [Rhodospirillaceae bacterium]|jgi:FAD/FMN-containing dehydrogenase|nr:FAD-binding oxidoreductase [Rhodospirillaceae bacterium]MBT5195106.1 FAD-binding oxidoreductase [Rhodospirillaceae bacterium]MBT5457952.1 FAD-binding oxidoreductase [Rhodospirillaceae bacterium]MBT5896766.1 FAD-binding oxidoreductase [Rhodospirillaceae bacterium]MBT7757665.1 FAD-binding oxidoreductase [Rhodospirillaceae bacterium]
MADFIAQLRDIVGDRGLILKEELSGRSAGYRNPDKTLDAKVLVRPANTEEVSAVLKLCNDNGQAVVSHGGLTGLVDGNIAGEDEVILSLERMREIEEIDPASSTMTVQTGVTLQTVQEAAEEAGFFFPLDLGGRGSATLGGNISTNAGGNRVVRYGMARDMVLGLEAVQADGTVLSALGKIIKDNAGYNLKHMFIGSEGTLGVVTRLVLRLRPKPASQQTAYLALDSFEKLPKLLNFCNGRSGGCLSAFEVMWQDYFKLVTSRDGAAQPLSDEYPFYVLMEVMGGEPDTDGERFENMLAAAMDDGLMVDAVIAKSEGERQAMWALRDDVESLRTWGPTIGFDVGLPIASMPDYLDEIDVPIVAEWPERKRAVFGHLGDGNLHIVYAVGEAGDNAKKLVNDSVYHPLASRGGSVSAEHGIGLLKKDYLEVSRSPAEIALMKQLKGMMDPNNILNPGKIFS